MCGALHGMRGMDYLDTVNAFFDEPEQYRFFDGIAWMRNERKSPRLRDQRNGVARGDLVLLFVRRPAKAEVLQKRFVVASGEPFLHQRAGNVRTPHGSRAGLPEHRLQRQRNAQLIQLLDDPLCPLEALCAEEREIVLQLSVPVVKEVSQEMDLQGTDVGAELNARYHLNAKLLADDDRFVDGPGMVMVGDADCFEPGESGLL